MLKSKICLLIYSVALSLTIASTAFGQGPPKKLLLEFVDAYLVYVPSSGKLQIAAEGSVLNYGTDWTVLKLKPYLYHVRQKFWADFYWKVNTSNKLKKAWRVTGGTFGQPGGTETPLKLNVRVIE